VTRPRLAAAAASGALLALARPPADLGPLALIALVPLFLAWEGVGTRSRAALTFIAGIVYYGALVSWAWYFGAVAIVPLVLALAAYWAAAGAVTGWLSAHGVRSPWLTAAVWVAAEAVVARFPLEGFSWGEVGYALHDLPPARDLAGVGGVAFLSFVVVALNAHISQAVARRRQGLPLTSTAAGIAAIVTLTAIAAVAAPEPETSGELRVAILQGNDKNRDLTRREKAERYLPVSHLELAEQVTDPVDLIIFPESSLDEDPRVDRALGRRLGAVAREHDAWVLGNAVADAPDGRAVNLNVLYAPDGTLVGTYTKRHLVPYGETVPLRSILERWIGGLERVPRDFAPGDRPGIFDIASARVATVICFESAFGYEVRPLVDQGAEAIVVSTNNRSYRRSANSAQHLAMSQIRAAETGRPVIHAGISGISAFVDARGNIHGQTDLFDRTLLERTVTTTRGETLYVRFGEWAMWGSVLAVAAAVAVAVVVRRRRSVDSTGTSAEDAPIASAGGPDPSADPNADPNAELSPTGDVR
jgi:apolipoprotein N-acyltransferase